MSRNRSSFQYGTNRTERIPVLLRPLLEPKVTVYVELEWHSPSLLILGVWPEKAPSRAAYDSKMISGSKNDTRVKHSFFARHAMADYQALIDPGFQMKELIAVRQLPS